MLSLWFVYSTYHFFFSRLLILCLFLYNKQYFKSYLIRLFRNFILNFITIWTYFTSSYPKLFCKKSVLENSTKSAGKHLCRSLFLINIIIKETKCDLFYDNEQYLGNYGVNFLCKYILTPMTVVSRISWNFKFDKGWYYGINSISYLIQKM